MMKAMRSTITETEAASQAQKIFREQMDDEHVEKWGDQGGIGLSDMIYKQLIDKYGPSYGITQAPEKPRGPIKVDEKSLATNPFKMESSQANKAKTTMTYDLQVAALESPEVSSPWKGSLLGVKSLNDDEHLVSLAHDNGLKSQLVFRGSIEKNLQGAQLQPGAEIQAGQRLGLLSPEAKSLFWTVDVADPL
jgi:peptidoglycan hydrolase FlgJ